MAGGRTGNAEKLREERLAAGETGSGLFDTLKNIATGIFTSQLPPGDATASSVNQKTVTEEKSNITQDEKNKLSPYIFSVPEVFEYPMKVGDDEYQPHSVRFYINARDNSRVAEQANKNMNEFVSASMVDDWNVGIDLPSGLQPPPNATAENRGSADQYKNISVGTGVIAGFALGAGAGVSILGFGSSGPSVLAKMAAGAIGGLVGAAAGGAIASNVIETVTKVRTLGAIELYVSAPPTAQYSANWENKELGALAGLGDAKAFFDDKGNFSIENALQSGGGIGDLATRGIIKAAASLPSGLGITGDLGASLDLASSKVANPYKEQLFSNMGFRQFAFNYKFTPRNATEYKHVQRIIKLFKYHMHPENDPTGLFLEYPSEFNIEYLYRGEENTHVSKISSCALTDIKITYGNQDSFTTIQGTKGAPAEINMQLAFTELETLTNDRIADGF